MIALASAFAVTSASAQQQQGGNGPQERGGPGMRLVEELALDEYQAAEVQAIFEAARALHQEERTRSFENNEAIRTETHAAISAPR